MDCQTTVVLDKAERLELIHKMVDPRPGCADHLRQIFLTDLGDYLFRFAFPSETGQQQEDPGQAFLAGIEELIHQVLFVADVLCEQKLHEKCCELGTLPKKACHHVLWNPQKQAFGDSSSLGYATWLTRKTSLSNKATAIGPVLSRHSEPKPCGLRTTGDGVLECGGSATCG